MYGIMRKVNLSFLNINVKIVEKMPMKTILISLLLISVFNVFSQGTLKSEEYDMSISYPEGWEHNAGVKGQGEVLFNLSDKRQKAKDMKLAISCTVVVEEAKFGGDIDEMIAAYHLKLKNRPELDKQKVTSKKIVTVSGVKAVDIVGTAEIPIIKQATTWRILLFEYKGTYFEIGAVASKKEFKKKEVQTDIEFLFKSITLGLK